MLENLHCILCSILIGLNDTFQTIFLLIAVPDLPVIIHVTHVPDSSVVTIFWKEPISHGCPIFEYVIYYRFILKNNDSHSWVKRRAPRAEVQIMQKYELHMTLGKRYEVMVTAVNSEGESSKELVIPRIVDLRSYQGEMAVIH